MKVIVGLGNPGPAYRTTRHNAGFRVLDRLAELLGTQFNREKYRAQVAEAQWAGNRVLLLKPMTYMNRSGESVALAARNNVTDPADLLVVYDEAELPLGRLRIRIKGTAGTHNGMKSVIERLGTQDVPRLRMGVAGDTGWDNLADYVLAPFLPAERTRVAEMIESAAKAARQFLENGLDTVMNEFNKR